MYRWANVNNLASDYVENVFSRYVSKEITDFIYNLTLFLLTLNIIVKGYICLIRHSMSVISCLCYVNGLWIEGNTYIFNYSKL